jgi:hypothetical protein
MPAAKGRKPLTQFETLYGAGKFNANNFLQAGGQLNVSETGLLADATPDALKTKIGVYAEYDNKLINDILGDPAEADISSTLSNDLVASRTVTGSNYNNVLTIINALLTTKSNAIRLRGEVVGPKSVTNINDVTTLSSNLMELWAASNSLVTTVNFNKYEARKTDYQTAKTALEEEKKTVKNELTANAEALEARKSSAQTRLTNLMTRTAADFAELEAIPTAARGSNYDRIKTSFQTAKDELPGIEGRIQSVEVPSESITSANTLLALRDVRNTLNSNLSKLEVAEYDMSGVNILTRAVVPSIQQVAQSGGADVITPLRQLTDAPVAALYKMSNDYSDLVKTTRERVTEAENTILTTYGQLKSIDIREIGDKFNTIIYVKLAELSNIDNDFRSNLPDSTAATNGLPMVLFDDDAKFATRQKNVTDASTTANAKAGEIIAALKETSDLFNERSNTLRTELTSRITTEANEFNTNYEYVVATVPQITGNMTSARQIMQESNYEGKYTYFYDYINAMLGLSNTITSNAPEGALEADPTGNFVRSNLYFENGDIKLRKDMYKYIDSRYSSIPNSYLPFKAEYDGYYNAATIGESNLDGLRYVLSNIQRLGVPRSVDKAQIQGYWTKITSDSNTETTDGLRAYISARLAAVGNPEAEKQLAATEAQRLWGLIQSTVAEVKTQTEIIRDGTEADLAFFSDADFEDIATKRASLLDFYAQAEFILKQDEQYFLSNFSDESGTKRTFIERYSGPVISALNTELNNDLNTLNTTIKGSPTYTGTQSSYNTIRDATLVTMKGVLSGYITAAQTLATEAVNKLAYAKNIVDTDTPRLTDKKLDSACFEFYPILVSAGNEITSNQAAILEKQTEIVNIATGEFDTLNTLAATDVLTERVLTLSNDINNIYLIGSNYSNVLQGKTDELLAAYNEAYTGIDKNIIDNLPLFKGENCTEGVVEVTQTSTSTPSVAT